MSLWWWALRLPGNQGVASPVVEGNRREAFFEPMYMYVGCEQQQVRGVKFWVVRYGDGGGGGGGAWRRSNVGPVAGQAHSSC